MQDLNLPEYDFRIQRSEGQLSIFDPVRKKYVALTPEEWVRQNFVQFLIHEKNLPAGLVLLEKTLTYNKMKRRPDVVAHDRQGKPLLIVECKAPDVKITQQTFDQIARYNSVLKVPYLIVTNGIKHYCCRMDYSLGNYVFLNDIPGYEEMINAAD
jgi:hypothetical protein